MKRNMMGRKYRGITDEEEAAIQLDKERLQSGDTYQSITVANGDRCVLHVGHLSCVEAVSVSYWLRVFSS